MCAGVREKEECMCVCEREREKKTVGEKASVSERHGDRVLGCERKSVG